MLPQLLLLEGEADAFHMAHGSGGRTALIEAAASGSAACVKLLLKHGGGLDVRQADEKTGTYPLLEAVAFGQLDAARVLLGVQGVKVNQTDKEGRTPLLLAARCVSVCRKEGPLPCVRGGLSRCGVHV